MRAGAAPADGTSSKLTGYYSSLDGGGGDFVYDAASVLADDGAMTIKPTAVGGGAGRWRRIYDWGRLNVKWFGAKCDWTGDFGGSGTDDTAAVNAAAAYVAARSPAGAYLYVPGLCRIAGQLTFANTQGLKIVGDGTLCAVNKFRSSWPVSAFIFTSDGSSFTNNNYGWAGYIDARSTQGFEMEGMGILQNSATFSGTYVDMTHYQIGGGDSAFGRFENCSFGNVYNSGTAYPITAQAGLHLTTVIECSVVKCAFTRILNGIRGQESIGSSIAYSNVVDISKCQFIQTPIAICNPGQNWDIGPTNTCEGLQQTATDYLHHFVADDIVCGGSIQELAKASHANGDLLTFDDAGFTAPKIFEYRVTAGSVGAGHVMVDISGTTTAAQAAAVLAAAIQGAGLRLGSVRVSGSAQVLVYSSLEVEAHPYTLTATAGGQSVSGMVTPDYAHDLLHIHNNWCGDAFGDQVWIRLLPCTTAEIIGNLLAGGAGGIHFYSNTSSPTCGAVEIKRNEIDTASGVGLDFDVGGRGIVWNGLDLVINDLEGAGQVLHLPAKYSTAIKGNRVERGGAGNFPDPSINGELFFPGIVSPLEITVSTPVEGWWSADALALANGAAVASWPDQSGNGHNLVQATAGQRPTFHTNVRYGMPVVRFDGTVQNMAAAFYNPAPFTVFIVFAATGSRVGNDTILDGPAGVDTMRLYRSSPYSLKAGGIPLGVFAQQWSVYCLEQNSQADGSSVMRVGDVSMAGNPTWSTVDTGGLIVGRDGGGANAIAADVGEIIVFNRPLYPIERRQVTNYLRARWVCL